MTASFPVDYASLAAAQIENDPFRWVHVARVFTPVWAEALSATFPAQGFRESTGREGHYQLFDRSVVEAGRKVDSEHPLPAPWTRLLDELLTERYREVVAAVAGVPLAGCELKVRLCRYGRGCWMLPHTDRPDRVVTQTIYLTPRWEPDWGGTLDILRSNDGADVARRVVPRFNTAVVFVRSATSFHAVAPVRGAAAAERLSVLVQFLDPALAETA